MTRQLGHGRHEGTATHVILELLWDWLLWGGVELLLERDWLEGSEPASNVVDDGNGLRLRRRQTCERGCSLNVGRRRHGETKERGFTDEERGLAQAHDAGQRRHDEALCGGRRGRQAVQRRQSAYWGQWAAAGHLRPGTTGS